MLKWLVLEVTRRSVFLIGSSRRYQRSESPLWPGSRPDFRNGPRTEPDTFVFQNLLVIGIGTSTADKSSFSGRNSIVIVRTITNLLLHYYGRKSSTITNGPVELLPTLYGRNSLTFTLVIVW
jgi:hypothetical protein